MKSGKNRAWEFHIEIRKTPYDLLVCILLALLLILLIVFVPDSFARQILGLAFILFLPGYAATVALFPERNQIDAIERVALSFGLSIAIVPLIGLGLNFTPWGIRLEPIMASVSTFIVTASAVGWYRRMRLPEDERFAIVIDFKLDWHGMHLMDKLLSISIVVMLVTSIVIIAWAITTPRAGEGFTQLTILGPDGMATDYPRNMTIGEEERVLISVKSCEHETLNYTIVLVLTSLTEQNFMVGQYSIDWTQVQNLDPYSGIAQNFTLNHLDFFNHTIDFTVSSEGTWKMQFLLYLNEEEYTQDAYREVHLWLNVTSIT